MSLDLSAILNTAGISTAVLAITGNQDSAAEAAGYGAWITSVTGRPPKVVRIGTESRAALVLDDAQKLAMQKWLNAQVGTLVSKGEPPVLDTGLGSSIGPWALQYAAPAMIACVAGGWILHWILNKR